MEASTSPDVWVVEDLQQQKLPARSLVSALQRAGVGARLVDLNQAVADLVATAQCEQPRLILGSILFADRVDDHVALMMALRTAGVHARLALTGHLPALASNTFLSACPALDFVLCGEGESIAADWVDSLCHAEAWERVPGMVGRQIPATAGPLSATDGSTTRPCGLPDFRSLADFGSLEPADPARPNCTSTRDLVALAFPSYDTIPLFRGYGFATIEASRGCYHACTFCLPHAFYARYGASYRSRGVASVTGEIEKLYRRGARLFLFDDDQFLPPGRARRVRIEAFASELARKNLRIAFTIKCRADDVEPGVFRQLKEIGLERVYVGIESGCQATLDLLGKQTTVQQNIDALVTLNELGIVADWRALVFHPWSTLEMLEAESAFLHRVSAQFATVVDWREVEVYAGTPLADRLRLEGRADADAWSIQYVIPDPRAELVRRMSRLVFCSDAYRRLCDAVTEAWYEVLLARRLQPGQSRGGVEAEARLRAVVARANEESLKVWEEMLAFARTGDVYSAEEVNARAGVWAQQINRAAIASARPSGAVNGREKSPISLNGLFSASAGAPSRSRSQ